MLNARICHPGLSNFHLCFWFSDPKYVLKSYFDLVLTYIVSVISQEQSWVYSPLLWSLGPRSYCLWILHINCLSWFSRSLPLLKFFMFIVLLTVWWVQLTPHISSLCYSEWEKEEVKKCERESLRVNDLQHLTLLCWRGRSCSLLDMWQPLSLQPLDSRSPLSPHYNNQNASRFCQMPLLINIIPCRQPLI